MLPEDDKPKYLRYERPQSHPQGTFRGDGIEGLHERTMGIIEEQARRENAEDNRTGTIPSSDGGPCNHCGTSQAPNGEEAL